MLRIILCRYILEFLEFKMVALCTYLFFFWFLSIFFLTKVLISFPMYRIATIFESKCVVQISLKYRLFLYLDFLQNGDLIQGGVSASLVCLTQ
jgi:hypothetical protein